MTKSFFEIPTFFNPMQEKIQNTNICYILPLPLFAEFPHSQNKKKEWEFQNYFCIGLYPRKFSNTIYTILSLQRNQHRSSIVYDLFFSISEIAMSADTFLL